MNPEIHTAQASEWILGPLTYVISTGLLVSLAGLLIPAGLKRIWPLISALYSLCLFLAAGWLVKDIQSPQVSRLNWLGTAGAGNWPLPSFSLRIDTPAVLMLMTVLLVSLLVHLYSLAYMKEDAKRHRYFVFVDLFSFCMSMLVVSGNLFTTFLFWEGVGLCSWLLIGFWHEGDKQGPAAQKAMVLNRVGDALFLAGIMVVWYIFSSTEYEHLQEVAARFRYSGWMTLAVLLIFGGVMGKSAQFPLQVWLPDAMAGPTPASAMIHAATMVAAGVYLLFRISPLIDPMAGTVIAVIGAITALGAAYSALSQWEIKKILAWSTVSQLGMMVSVCGTMAVDHAFFHLLSHAFFKCGLFLIAGIFIHAWQQKNTSDPNDIRNLSGLKDIPAGIQILFLFLLAALAGIPLSSGFLSKEGLLNSAWSWASSARNTAGPAGWIVPLSLILTTFLTATYSARLYFLLFHPIKKNETQVHFHSSGWMNVPVFVCAVLSLGMIWSFPNPFSTQGVWVMKYLNAGIVMHEGLGEGMAVLSILSVLAGILFAWARMRNPDTEHKLLSGLSFHHFYLDHFYERQVRTVFLFVAEKLKGLDAGLFDGWIRATASALFGAWNFRFSLTSIMNTADQLGIDALANAGAKGIMNAGRNLKAYQPARMQLWLLLSVASFLLILLGLIYFSRF